MHPNNSTQAAARPLQNTRIHGLPYLTFEQAYDLEQQRRRERDERQQQAQKARIRNGE